MAKVTWLINGKARFQNQGKAMEEGSPIKVSRREPCISTLAVQIYITPGFLPGVNYQENLVISGDPGFVIPEAPLHIKGLFLVSVSTPWLDRTRPWKLYLELPGLHFPTFFQRKYLAGSEDCLEHRTTEISLWGNASA